MPELPEVETIRLGLQKYLVGHRIERVEVKLTKMVSGDVKNVTGVKVTGIRRAGKGLIIDLDNSYSIAIHIKLTGQLVYKETPFRQGFAGQAQGAEGTQETKVKVIKNSYANLPNQWTHVIFHLDKGAVLYYNDFRQFGWIKIVKEDEVSSLPFFKDLGPEFPLVKVSKGEKVSQVSKGGGLTFALFEELLKKSKTAIKPLIMDQKKMSGLGNIYANDGLYLAGIDPRRSAKEISADEAKRLYEALEKVLKKGLETGGASELSFINVLGEEGKYQNHMLAYGKEGEKCKRCGGTFEKIMLGGRGTYFCPGCQR